MAERKLTNTSYAVLGLLELRGPATPYYLKQLTQISIAHFWSIPHTQVYRECARLAAAGLAEESREEGGRRRRVYSLSSAGRKALNEWRADTETAPYELHDPGLLKLFCGADPAALARVELERHERRLHTFEAFHENLEMERGMRLALEAGIGHAREYVRFWTALSEGEDEKP